MQPLILHHYAMSPFSAKVRAMFGYTGLDWQSVVTREMPPRPKLAALAGGYRKIPVAQCGADVFCDSRTIAAEIAARGSRPLLALENCSAEAQGWASEVDLQIFLACMLSAGSPALRRKVRASMGWGDIARFAWDRLNLGRKSAVRGVSLGGARPRVQQHMADMEARLTREFLFGNEPCHADFSAYHSLWFIRDLAESRRVADFPKVMAWMDRIAAFGEGSRSEISADDALAIAGQSTPRAIAAEHAVDALVGKPVNVAPADYARDGTDGVLVGSTPARWIIARDAPGAGLVHVHFPKQGFMLTPG